MIRTITEAEALTLAIRGYTPGVLDGAAVPVEMSATYERDGDVTRAYPEGRSRRPGDAGCALTPPGVTVDYQLDPGWRHALAEPAILDGYAGPCWAAVYSPDAGFQWHPAWIVAPMPADEDGPRWIVRGTVLGWRHASHLALPAPDEMNANVNLWARFVSGGAP